MFLFSVCGAVVAFALGGIHERDALAQMLDPNVAEQAYLTADPIDADRLGLATPDGRYAIRCVQGCDSLVLDESSIGPNVLMWPGRDLPPWLELAPVDWDASAPAPWIVRVEGRMDATPCFTNEDGQCDAAAEGD